MATTPHATSTLLTSSEIKGTTVRNLQNEDIGEYDSDVYVIFIIHILLLR
jgi:hypothetical protein